jgi:serine/threonine-protein kinase
VAYRDAVGIQKRLAADFPAVADYRHDLSQSYNNLGVLLQHTGRRQDAEATYRDALEIHKRLAADFPAVAAYRRSLAISHTNLSGLLMDAGLLTEAEPALRDALEMLKRLVADNPAVPDYQAFLANTMDGLAEIALDRKDYASARQLLEGARPHLQVALDTSPRYRYYRGISREIQRDLAAALLGLGDHAGSALGAAELARRAFQPAIDAYDAACLLARCIPVAQKDAKLPEARRKELTQSYGDQAMAALRQAVANGYKDMDYLRKDKNLDSLRQRDDFQKLLAEPKKDKPKDK